MSIPKLFQPIKVGNLELQHRVVHAPLTRFKATKRGHVQIQPMVKEYYSQRSNTPGTFLLSEATLIHEKAGGYHNVPGIWTDEHIASWKQVTSIVHGNKSFMFNQLWALGRVADPQVLKEKGIPFTAPSPTLSPDAHSDVPPRELTIEEIGEVVQLYAQAANNAVFKAGFDGVEIHGANGYLFDQFLQDMSNIRSDKYGGNIENRSRFGLEVMDAVVNAVGAERVGVRLSPWSTFQGMGMKNPIPQFAHFISELKLRHPKLAYIHVIEPRVNGNDDKAPAEHESSEPLRAIWSPLAYLSAGGHDRKSALAVAETTGSLVTFGRHFLANPDLPIRLKDDIPLNKYDRKTFYVPGDSEAGSIGYADYPFITKN